jgi:hypothetical protein
MPYETVNLREGARRDLLFTLWTPAYTNLPETLLRTSYQRVGQDYRHHGSKVEEYLLQT